MGGEGRCGDDDGTSYTGTHCGLTDKTDYSTCECWLAGQHPTIGTSLPSVSSGAAHDIALNTTLPDHHQAHGNMTNNNYTSVIKGDNGHVRHNDGTTQEHNPVRL